MSKLLCQVELELLKLFESLISKSDAILK